MGAKTFEQFGVVLREVLKDHALRDHWGPECECGFYPEEVHLYEAFEGSWCDHILEEMAKKLGEEYVGKEEKHG